MSTRHFQFDAFHAQRALRDRMADYLLETFGVRDPALADRLRGNWTATGTQSERLIAPMLVQGAFPFRPGKTLRELCAQSSGERDPARPLHPKTVALLEAAGMTYRLHQHQVESICATAQGKTLVLSAGTGSGKTEAFLVPLIDRLMWDHEHGRDNLNQPGIRALIIYPLNALVNNQIERILELVRGQDQITFAYYTSRLKEDGAKAKHYYRSRQREVPPSCQIIDRQSLRGVGDARRSRQGPPHILVTNFAMLEYMLIRPTDRSIFEHIYYQGEPRLRTIVLDEAHVYAGAQATEIHMLLRRAAHRFGSTLERIQGIATSATLGNEADARSSLVRFAGDMFSSAEDEVEVVIGKRHLPDEGGPVHTTLGGLCVPVDVPESEALVPEDLRTLRFDDQGKPVELVRDEKLARKAAHACLTLGLLEESEIEELVARSEGTPARLIHHVVSRHPRLVALRRWLFAGRERDDEAAHETRYIDEIVRWLYPELGNEVSEDARRATHAILQLGSLARLSPAQHPFIPTRMHLFMRAPAGAWVAPRPDSKSSSAWPWGEATSRPQSSDDEPWLALCLCGTCGAPMLQAWRSRDDWGDDTIAASHRPGAAMVALYPDADAGLQLDASLGSHRVRAIPIVHGGERSGRDTWQLEQCPRCASKDVELERLRLSPQAALPALIDALYPSLGEMQNDENCGELPGGGRRMLTFSDSRQGAARVAADVERTHDMGVNRQILWRTLLDLTEAEGQEVPYGTLFNALVDGQLLRHRAEFSAIENSDDGDADEKRAELALVSIYEEFARPPAKGNSLEKLGLVEVVYPRMADVPAELVGRLRRDEWHALLATVLDDARRRGAVEIPRFSVMESLRDLLPRNRLNRRLTLAKGPAEPDEYELDDDASAAWRQMRETLIPLIANAKPERGRMFDFATRLCVHAELNMEPERLLRVVWDALLGMARDTRCKWLKPQKEAGEECVQINLGKLAFRAHADGPLFIESTIGRVHFRSAAGVSPEHGSTHEVRAMSDEERSEWRARHAVRRVLDHELLGLWSVEHTAQIDVDQLEDQERDFRMGKRNLMASSTTMEMGVDLGGLTLVLLTNVPPGPANYWQRAGRAGRRADGSSLAMTLTLARPHDHQVFLDPRAFLERPITPPSIRRDTRQLILRHVYAFLLTAFYQRVVVPASLGNPMSSFGTVKEFLIKPVSEFEPAHIRAELIDELGVEPGEALADLFERWLDVVDKDTAFARNVSRLVAGTDLTDAPLTALLRDCARAFVRARDRVRNDLDVLAAQRAQEKERGEAARDERFLRFLDYHQRVLEDESLIGYLARTDFLPRFGFPVDVVQLDTTHEISERDSDDRKSAHPDENSSMLRMERGLETALAEYAPGGEVIAKKRIYRVAGLHRDWRIDDNGTMAKTRYYVECMACHHVSFRDAEPHDCEVCGHPAESESAFWKRKGNSAVQGKNKIEAPGQGDSGELDGNSRPPSPVRSYLVPTSLAVKMGVKPRRVAGKVHRMPPPRMTIDRGRDDPGEVLPGALAMGFTPESQLFIRSEGHSGPRSPLVSNMQRTGYGYRICKDCGFAEPEDTWGEKPPARFVNHQALRSKAGRCRCATPPWKHAVLGVKQTVDAYRVRLLGDLEPPNTDPDAMRSFYLSLAICLQIEAARRLNVDSRTLSATVATYERSDQQPGFEAVLYDSSASGMLSHLDEAPLELMRDVLDLLENGQFADFVQFDTQYLIEHGDLRIPWLRNHLVEDAARRALIRASAGTLYHREDATPLRGESPRMAAQRMFEEPGMEIALQAIAIEESAFERGQLLRALLARAIGQASAARARILIAAKPELGASPEQLLLAKRLQDLMDSGVEIRLARGQDIDGCIWGILGRSPRKSRALGCMQMTGAGEAAVWNRAAFGREWLRGGIHLISRSQTAADLAWLEFDERWERGLPLSSEALTPAAAANRQWIFTIANGSRVREDTSIEALLQERTGLGSLREFGCVLRLQYNDRFVGRSAMAMWLLDRLLGLFEYAPGAQAIVYCFNAKDDTMSIGRSAEQILSMDRLPRDLDRETAKQFEKWCKQRSAKRDLQLHFEHGREDRIRHQRKLVVEFEPGGRVGCMMVLFEHGLDWIRPVPSRDKRPWTEQPMQAEETHLAILLDP
jgi:ATP-dependent helicase YprA (DUF1998 family)